MTMKLPAMLSCKEASHLVSEGLDRDLKPGERLRLRLHLWMCVNCRRFERQTHYLRRILRRCWRGGDPPVGRPLSEEARSRIRRMLEKQIRNGG